MQFKFKRKIRSWTGIRTSDLQISSLALQNLSYPGSIDGTGLNLSLESNAMLGVVVCGFITTVQFHFVRVNNS